MGSAVAAPPRVQTITLVDANRERPVPVQLYFPANGSGCLRRKSCPVAFISPGYGMPHTSYSFIADALAAQGYFAIAVQHDLPSDPPLNAKGDLVTVRTPAWQRGAENLQFTKRELSRLYPDHDWSALTLVGHSNGGDISSLLLRDTPGFATGLITLDHRRVPLPRSDSLKVLSIRASDFEADPDVLPSESEAASTGTCIVEIPGSRHNDMADDGPSPLKAEINTLISGFLRSGSSDI
jgi:pimeloyl-ACP methyl ester carboxylesterase